MSETKSFRIFKYPIEIVDEQLVEMPAKAEPIAAQFQDGALVVWAFVNPARPTSPRRFRIVGTGNPVEGNPGLYLATVQEPHRPLVWHIFWS